jgi:exodeoxyribonuclease VII small subunit
VASEGAVSPSGKLDGLNGLDYESAREALAEVVAKLEAGNLALEESLELWERGESLAKVCRARLDGARARLDAVLGAGESPG